MRKKVYHLSLQKEFQNRISFFGYTKSGENMKILITGATSGIAYEVAKQLIKKGHTLYLGSKTEKERDYLKEKLKQEHLDAICLKLDVTAEKDLKKIENIELDCLINHAGIGIGGSILNTDIKDLRKVYETNIFGNFELLQRVYHNMIKKNKRGKLLITSSLAASLPFPYLGFYTSSKAAISQLAFTMRKELKILNPNISISLIEPGAYHTGFNQVMIDNKGKLLWENEKIEEQSITRLQRNLFALIEKRNLSSIVRKIEREVEKEKPKFKIRAPLVQRIGTKLYVLFFK